MAFPEIAIYNKLNTYNFAFSYKGRRFYQVLRQNSLIVLIKQNENHGPPYFYFIPLEPLLTGTLPLTAITRWHKSYSRLPRLHHHNFTTLSQWLEENNGKRNNTADAIVSMVAE